MRYQLLVFVALFVVAYCSTDDNRAVAYLNTSAYLEYYNYPVEVHKIVTEDGYILTFFRTQAKNTTIVTNGKPVILLWHGLLDSSDTWITNTEDLAPALLFANLGYDVWLANSRGNHYSLGHTKYNSLTSEAYWQFSWQQMAQYDAPAAFGYIVDLTKQKINYVGHSQGTMQMFGALSDPLRSQGIYRNITDNLRKFAALGPVAYLNHMESTLLVDLTKVPFIVRIVQALAKYGLMLPSLFDEEATYYICTYLPSVCSASISFLADLQTDIDNMKRFPVWVAHFPAGTSTMNLVHYDQAYQDGQFKKYDYGEDVNKIMYGQSEPPLFDVTLITEDVALFAGSRDELADLPDVQVLYDGMTNAKNKELHVYDAGHLTFLLGKTLPYWDDLNAFLDIPKSADQ